MAHAVDRYDLAHGGGCTPERALGEGVGNDHNPWRPGNVVGGLDQPAISRRDAERLEKARRDPARANALRPAGADDRHSRGPHCAEGGEAALSIADCEDVHNGDRTQTRRGVPLIDAHQPFGIGIRQSREQDAVDYDEDGRGRADAEAERGHHG